MVVPKGKYEIIHQGGKKYILASQASDYVAEDFMSPFGIPAPRTIRYYIKESIIERPLKLGKQVYFETGYIVNVLKLMRELRYWNLTLTQTRQIVLNVRRYNQFEETFALLDVAKDNPLIKIDYKKRFISQLASKRPSEIRISKIEAEIGKGKTAKQRPIPW